MKSSLKSAVAVLFFIVLVFNSTAAFADTNLCYVETNSFWETNTQNGLTMRTFNRMKTGMTLAAVNKMIGFKGTVISSQRGGGKLFEAYKWEGDDYRIITAVFEENRLTSKYQANLK